jgi:hypothetical protein
VTSDQPRSVERPGSTPTGTVGDRRVLSTWSARDWTGGVHVDDLAALDRVVIRTENSTYEIVVLSPASASVLVRGGAFFPVFMPARLAGSSLGGSFLKMRSIHVGFRLELNTERGFIRTSAVRAIDIAPAIRDSSGIM